MNRKYETPGDFILDAETSNKHANKYKQIREIISDDGKTVLQSNEIRNWHTPSHRLKDGWFL